MTSEADGGASTTYNDIDCINTLMKAVDNELEEICRHYQAEYGSYDEMSNDPSLRDVAPFLRDCKTQDAIAAPTLFKLILQLSMAKSERDAIAKSSNDDVRQKIAAGLSPLPIEYTNKSKTDPDNIRLAAKVDKAMITTSMLVHFILNARKKGTVSSPWVFLLTSLLKECGLSTEGIDTLSRLHITTSNTTCTNTISESVEQYYNRVWQDLIDMVDARGQDKQPEYFFVVLIDNFNRLSWALESMKSGKTFSRQNDTLSTLYHGWQKPPEMKRHQGRDGVNTDLNTSIRSTAECAVMSGSVGILDFGDLMLKRNADGSIYINEIGDTVRCVNSGNGRARLHDFRSFGNLPFKSGHGRSHIQVETKMICHGVFGADANEIALPLDPEFGWQLMRLTQTLRDETRMMCPLPPPFHCGKHLTECHWRDPIFMIMLVIPLLQQLRMKSSVFNDQLQRNILEWIMSATASDFYSLDKCLALLRTDSTNEDGELDMPDVDEPEDDVEAGDDDEEDSVGSIRESIIAAMEDQKITQISGLREVEAIAEFASARHINMRAHSQEDKPKVKRFMAAQRELTKTWIINYKRMKYITEILFNAYEHIKEECEADFNANSLTMLMKYFLDVMLRVTVEPLEKLIVDGDIEDFWRYLPAYCRLFAFGDKPRITRVFIYHLCIILHCKEKRPDWLRAIAGISTWTNEVYIEHANSVLARHLTSKSVTDDFTLTRLCSLLVDRIRCDKNSWRELQHVSQVGGESNSLLKKRRRDSTDAKLSEPAHQMRRFKHGGSDFNYARDIGNKVLKPLVQAYSRIKIPSKVSRVLDSYRPLQMATAIIPTHFKALDKFLSDVREEEARELIPNAGVIDECYYFLDKQVMGECLMPLTCFFAGRARKCVDCGQTFPPSN